MLRLLPHVLAGLASLVLAQPTVSAEDLTVVPGKRVGLVTAYSSLPILQALFGRSNVRSGKIPGMQGEVIDGAIIYAGTDRELQVVWKPDAVARRIESVRVKGRAWKFVNGLTFGMTVSEVEALNGRPFLISGFNWDFGGFARFDGGLLAEGVAVRFRPGEEGYGTALTGDKRIASDNAELLAISPLVSELSVVFQQRP